MNDDVWFRVEGREYPLAQRKAELLSEALRAFDPDLGYEESVRRSLSEAIERCLVHPTQGPIWPDRSALSALEHQLDYMGSGGDRQVAILQRAARRALGHPESPILDKIIDESGET